ncbi:MAG: PEP-CTERM sorting domain-containing protein [Opitutaceae bacterium]|jgi:hypothetical protein|nr:PEP-CTERM sorting domain-containing protein [Opitutaceae bacterium]
MRINKLWLTALFFGTPLLTAPATTHTWTGAAGNGFYHDGRNWEGNLAPVSSPDTVIVYGGAGAGEILLPPGEATVGALLFTHASGTYAFRCMTEGAAIVNVAGNPGSAGIKISTGGSVVFGESVELDFQNRQSVEVAEGGALVARGAMRGVERGGVLSGAGAGARSDLAVRAGHTERFSSSFNEFLDRIGAIADPNAVAGMDAAGAAGRRGMTENGGPSAGSGSTRTRLHHTGTGGDAATGGVITPSGGGGPAGPSYLTAVHGGVPAVIPFAGGVRASAVHAGQAGLHEAGGGMGYATSPRNDYTGGSFVLGGASPADGSGGAAAVLDGGALQPVEAGAGLDSRIAFMRGAALSGWGMHALPASLGAGESLSPGGSGAADTLDFTEGLTLEAGSLINLDLRSATLFDRLCVWQGFQIVGSVNDPIIIKLYSLDASGQPGLYAGFDPTQGYAWRFAYANDGAFQITGFNPDFFLIDDTEFSSLTPTNGGVFGIEMGADGSSIGITFTPVPEPGTYALMGLGIAMLAAFEVRRRKKSRAVSGTDGDGSDRK